MLPTYHLLRELNETAFLMIPVFVFSSGTTDFKPSISRWNTQGEDWSKTSPKSSPMAVMAQWKSRTLISGKQKKSWRNQTPWNVADSTMIVGRLLFILFIYFLFIYLLIHLFLFYLFRLSIFRMFFFSNLPSRKWFHLDFWGCKILLLALHHCLCSGVPKVDSWIEWPSVYPPKN